MSADDEMRNGQQADLVSMPNNKPKEGKISKTVERLRFKTDHSKII